MYRHTREVSLLLHEHCVWNNTVSSCYQINYSHGEMMNKKKIMTVSYQLIDVCIALCVGILDPDAIA